MTINPEGIILDRDYSEGFIAAAFSNGYLKFRCKTKDDAELADSFITRIRRSRFKKKSLELALLFKDVHLNDPFQLADFGRLYEEGVISSHRITTPERHRKLNLRDPAIAKLLEPVLLKGLYTAIKKFDQDFKKSPGFVHRYVRGLLDFMILWESGLPQEAVETPNFIPIRNTLIKQGNAVLYIDKLFDQALKTDKIHPFVAHCVALSLEIESILSLMDFSIEKNLPFATSRIRLYRGKKELETLQETYTLCALLFKEEVKYAPVVDSIDDLLRLREKPEINRFREVMNMWKMAMLKGEIDIAERMRVDISKANKEIRKLDKWKNVDKWLYYFTLPTVLVPYVSNLITIGSIITRTYIERKQRTHGWIAITR